MTHDNSCSDNEDGLDIAYNFVANTWGFEMRIKNHQKGSSCEKLPKNPLSSSMFNYNVEHMKNDGEYFLLNSYANGSEGLAIVVFCIV